MKIDVVNRNKEKCKEWLKRNNYVRYQVHYDGSFKEVGFIYYPKDMENNETLKKNIPILLENIDRYIDKILRRNYIYTVISNLKFDIEKKPYKEQLEMCDKELIDIQSKINANLSPYYWDIEILDSEGDIFKKSWRARLRKCKYKGVLNV